jgi:tetratricopeptide (TPR) repeat protein
MLGGRFGKYRILSELGSGGMATVYLGEAEPGAPGLPAGGRVAIKVVHPHLITKQSIFQRFLREFDVGRQVHHPNVVRTFDAGYHQAEGGPVHYIVMEYVEGQNLRELLEVMGWLPEHLCLHVAGEVTRGLRAIHDAGIIHRDLKPENVIITPDDVVKLMDLGIAFVKDESFRLSVTGQFVGSLLYSAPEQFHRRGAALDGRTDLYQLGVVLYELAAGAHPFGEDELPGLADRPTSEGGPRPSQKNPRISPYYDELVSQLLQRRPEHRFASARELLQVLEEGESSTWWRRRSGRIRRKTRRPLRRMRIPRDTSLYGREQEMTTLARLWEKAREGEGQVAIIDGEPGIGKTRLLDEFVGLLEVEGNEFRFLFGGYPPGGAATAAGAFSTAYREHLGTDRLEHSLAGHLTVTPTLVPAFAALLKGEPPPSGGEPLTRESIQTVFIHLTKALAAERPALVLIEDLHYAPEEGRALFAAMAHALASCRVLLVATTHPGLSPQWIAALERLPHITSLALRRLSFRHVREILAEDLGSPRLAEELCPVIAGASGGNPLFVFEILRGLQQENRLVRKPDGSYSRVGSIADVGMPATVRDLVHARIAGLSEADRELLDQAACIGFEFDPVLLAEATGEGKIPLLKQLGRLERHYRLVHSCGRSFVFDHQQIRETLYEDLSDLLCEEYHASLAEALERLQRAAEVPPAELPGRVCYDLCDHFLRGGRGAKALRYLECAQEHLQDGHLLEPMLDLLDRSLAPPELLLGCLRAEVLVSRAEALELLGRHEEEKVALEEAAALAEEAGDKKLVSEVHLALGNCLHSLGEMDSALDHYRQARDLAVAAGDREKEGSAVGRIGGILDHQGKVEEAREAYVTHREIAREIGDRLGEAKSIGNLGLLCWEQGRSEDALGYYDECLPIFRELGHLRGEGGVANSRGLAMLALGRYEEARAQFERQREIAREIGYRRGECMALANLGMVFQNLGRYAEAEESFTAIHEIWKELGNPLHEAISLMNLAHIALLLGEIDRVARILDACERIVREIGYRAGEAHVLYDRGRVAEERGEEERAEEAYRLAMEVNRELGNPAAAAGIGHALGRMMYWSGRREDAAAELAPALEGLAEAGQFSQCILVLGYLTLLDDSHLPRFLEHIEKHAGQLSVEDRMEAHYLDFLVRGEPESLEEAYRLLQFLAEHAPPASRPSLVRNLNVNRRIREAAGEAGLPPFASEAQ